MLPDLHFLGLCWPGGLSGPPYMGVIRMWNLHEADFDGISLQLKCSDTMRIHIHNWTVEEKDLLARRLGVIFLSFAPRGVCASGFVLDG